MQKIMTKDALEVIHERKSVRNFTGELVSPEDIDIILRAAMAAPVAIHMMPWQFIIIRDPEKLKTLSEGLPFAKMLPKAGTAIVVCAAPQDAALGKEEFAILDCACASENMLLAAEALGLGAVWTAVYPSKDLMNFVRKELGIPHNIIPVNIIPIGFPMGNEQAEDKFEPDNIHWEKW